MSSYNDARSFIGTKLAMPCWKDREFLADIAAMKYNLTDKQRLRLREETSTIPRKESVG